MLLRNTMETKVKLYQSLRKIPEIVFSGRKFHEIQFFNEDSEVKFEVLRECIQSELDAIAIMYYSNSFNRHIPLGTLAIHLRNAYSNTTIENDSEKIKKAYLDLIKKPHILNGIELYFENIKQLRLPLSFWNIPSIYSEDKLYVLEEEALSFLKSTNTLELILEDFTEVHYCSAIFQAEDTYFYMLHSNRITSDTKELIDPQITSVMKLKDKIKVLECNY